MKQILQNLKTGEFEVAEVPQPAVSPGHLLVQSRCSLISAGTERMLVSFTQSSLLGKTKQQKYNQLKGNNLIRILHITNIIGPYRQHLFNAWAEDCREKGMELHTAFMARGEPTRPWDPKDYPINHPHKFYSGIHVPVPKLNRPIHINPGIWWDMLHQHWDIVVVGGYDNITSALAGCLPKRSQLRLFWSEGNPLRSQHMGWFARSVKSLLVSPYDAYIVPGDWGRELIETLRPDAKHRPFIYVPNVINEKEFKAYRPPTREVIAARRQKWNLPIHNRILLFVGRLDENKGAGRIIDAVKKIKTPMTLLIAGSGPLQERFEAEARTTDATQQIRLVGYQKPSDIADLMGISDGFILASLYDCWPLVVIEAATIGLPILCSERVGNCRDIVRAGWNGWVFDPTNVDSILDAVNDFAKASVESLAEMGKNSARLTDEKFQTSKVVQNLNEKLLELYRSRRVTR